MVISFGPVTQLVNGRAGQVSLTPSSFHSITRLRNCTAVGSLGLPCESETKTEALKFPSFTKEESNLAVVEQILSAGS